MINATPGVPLSSSANAPVSPTPAAASVATPLYSSNTTQPHSSTTSNSGLPPMMPPANSGAGTASSSPQKSGSSFFSKGKTKLRLLIGVAILLVVAVGAAAAFFLSQQNQDVRQDASGIKCSVKSEKSCIGKYTDEKCADFSFCSSNDGVSCTCKAVTQPTKPPEIKNYCDKNKCPQGCSQDTGDGGICKVPYCNTGKCLKGCAEKSVDGGTCNAFCNLDCGTLKECIPTADGGYCKAKDTPTSCNYNGTQIAQGASACVKLGAKYDAVTCNNAAANSTSVTVCSTSQTCTNGKCVNNDETSCSYMGTAISDKMTICANNAATVSCSNGKAVVTDCKVGQECTNGKCVEKSVGGADPVDCKYNNSTYPSGKKVCTDANSYISCLNAKYTITDCLSGQMCTDGRCVEKTTATPTCFDGPPTASVCRGNVVNSNCTGFQGICRANGTNDAGDTLCGCVPTTKIADNGSCTDDANCASGYCRKTQTPFVCRPASERPGTLPPAGQACPNNANQAAKYIKFTCPNGCTYGTESDGVAAWRCYGENGGTRQEATTPLTLNNEECGQVDVIDTNGNYCGYLPGQYTCNLDKCKVTTNSPPPSNPPSVPPTNPPGPICMSISMTNITRVNQSPILGDAVNFTCGTVTGASSYIFKVTEPDGGEVELQATGAVSTSYTISQSGRFHAQCQICVKTSSSAAEECRPYETLPTSNAN